MANAEEARLSICGKFGLKPLTSENILYYYAPIQGIASYTALAVNVMNPSLVVSAFGAVTFSLGSILIWAIARSVVPQNVALCTACGIGSGLALLKVATSYVDHIDSLVKPSK